MATYTSAMLTGGGLTTHYQFSYDTTLAQGPGNPSGPEPARTNALITAAEQDYDLMNGWFGAPPAKVTFPITVLVTPLSNGATVGIDAKGACTITLKPGAAPVTMLRYLMVSEVTEVLMAAQGLGWYGDGTEGSAGEGLSRYLAAYFLRLAGLGATPAGYDIARLWLSGTRGDYVNTIQRDNSDPNEKSGCAMLFLHYLSSQLGFTPPQIVAAAAATLGGVYTNLTHDPADPFPDFARVLNDGYPAATFTAISGPDPDNPFPLPSSGRLSMRSVIATFANPDAFSVGQVLSVTGQRSLRPALNSRRRAALL